MQYPSVILIYIDKFGFYLIVKIYGQYNNDVCEIISKKNLSS